MLGALGAADWQYWVPCMPRVAVVTHAGCHSALGDISSGCCVPWALWVVVTVVQGALHALSGSGTDDGSAWGSTAFAQ